MNTVSLVSIIVLIFCLLMSGVQASDIRVIGLFTDKALLQIDSQQKLLSKGQTFAGVTLISASGRGAVIAFNGEVQKLQLNQKIQGKYKKPDRSVSRIFADFQGMFYVAGHINGRPMRFLVDTGATYVTMSGAHASKIGIDYKKGIKSFANTAAATVPVWQVKLDSVSVGDIKLANVEATVIEGAQPYDALLGNSFLKYTQLQHIGNVMEIKQKF